MKYEKRIYESDGVWYWDLRASEGRHQAAGSGATREEVEAKVAEYVESVSRHERIHAAMESTPWEACGPQEEQQ